MDYLLVGLLFEGRRKVEEGRREGTTQDTRTKTNYTQQMITLRDRIAPLAGAFGIPTARSLVIQRRFQEAQSALLGFTPNFAQRGEPPHASSLQEEQLCKREGKTRIDYLEIDPKPIIERVPPSIAQAFNSNQQIKIDDLQISGISRKYPREWVVGTGISYFVDAQLLLNRIVGGFEAEFVSVDELPLTWNLILRRRPDERRGV